MVEEGKPAKGCRRLFQAEALNKGTIVSRAGFNTVSYTFVVVDSVRVRDIIG